MQGTGQQAFASPLKRRGKRSNTFSRLPHLLPVAPIQLAGINEYLKEQSTPEKTTRAVVQPQENNQLSSSALRNKVDVQKVLVSTTLREFKRDKSTDLALPEQISEKNRDFAVVESISQLYPDFWRQSQVEQEKAALTKSVYAQNPEEGRQGHTRSRSEVPQLRKSAVNVPMLSRLLSHYSLNGLRSQQLLCAEEGEDKINEKQEIGNKSAIIMKRSDKTKAPEQSRNKSNIRVRKTGMSMDLKRAEELTTEYLRKNSVTADQLLVPFNGKVEKINNAITRYQAQRKPNNAGLSERIYQPVIDQENQRLLLKQQAQPSIEVLKLRLQYKANQEKYRVRLNFRQYMDEALARQQEDIEEKLRQEEEEQRLKEKREEDEAVARQLRIAEMRNKLLSNSPLKNPHKGRMFQSMLVLAPVRLGQENNLKSNKQIVSGKSETEFSTQNMDQSKQKSKIKTPDQIPAKQTLLRNTKTATKNFRPPSEQQVFQMNSTASDTKSQESVFMRKQTQESSKQKRSVNKLQPQSSLTQIDVEEQAVENGTNEDVNNEDNPDQFLYIINIEQYKKRAEQVLRENRQRSALFFQKFVAKIKNDQQNEVEARKEKLPEELQTNIRRLDGLMQRCDEESSALSTDKMSIENVKKKLFDDLLTFIQSLKSEAQRDYEADIEGIMQDEKLHQYLRQQIDEVIRSGAWQILENDNAHQAQYGNIRKYLKRSNLSSQVSKPLLYNQLLYNAKKQIMQKNIRANRCYSIRQEKEMRRYVNFSEFVGFK